MRRFLVLVGVCLLSTNGSCQRRGCVNPPDITVTPSTNQTVAATSTTIINYQCSVDNGLQARWEIMGSQIPLMSDDRDVLAARGITITGGVTESEVFLSISRTGREAYGTTELKIACHAFDTTQVRIASFGCNFFVRIFGSPTVPPNLELNPFPDDLSHLVLTWDQPNNTLVDTGDPVVTTYTVSVSGPTFNFTNTTTDTSYEIVDSLDEECAEHTFSVFASNNAGDGPSDVIKETIPISPDIRDLNAQLTVSDVFLTTPIRIEVSFLPANVCSLNFPLISYLVNIIDVNSTTFSANDSRILGRDLITLDLDTGLLPNQVYSLSVSACISVTCRESSTVAFMTTDVQSANIVFFEDNLYLTCSFASSSSARGCMFVFTAPSNITEEFNVSQSESGLCAQLQNMENVYTSIIALDWESDGQYGILPIVPTRNRTDTAEEFMELTGCTLPTPSVMVVQQLSPGAIAAIVVVVILLVIAVVAGVVIAIVAKKCLDKQKEETDSQLLREQTKPLNFNCVPEDDSTDGSVNSEELSVSGGGSRPVDTSSGPPPPPRGTEEVDGPEPSPQDYGPAKFEMTLEHGRKKGKVTLNRSMLEELMRRMGGRNEVEYDLANPLLG